MERQKTGAGDALTRDMERIRRYVNSFVRRGDSQKAAFDMEDLYQEAYIAYLEAYARYDESRGTDMMTWAARPIRWAVEGFLRSGEIKTACMKDHADPEEEMDGTASPADDVTGRMYVSRINRVLKDVYDHHDAKSYRYGVIAILAEEDGASRAETAERLGVSTSYLAACRARVRDLIAPMFEKGNLMETFAAE